jgi:hypothetical protein
VGDEDVDKPPFMPLSFIEIKRRLSAVIWASLAVIRLQGLLSPLLSIASDPARPVCYTDMMLATELWQNEVSRRLGVKEKVE